jgi:hypothetical protein
LSEMASNAVSRAEAATTDVALQDCARECVTQARLSDA